MKGKKTNSEYIIDTLLSRKKLRSPDITAMVAKAAAKEVKIQDIASILAKLSNPEKCELGHLILKQKSDRGYTYTLVEEAFSLAPKEIYDLTRKTGKDRFSLEMAVKKAPGLKKHIRPIRKKPVYGKKRAAKLAAEKGGAPISDEAFKGLVAGFLKSIAEEGGLNINVTLNVQFKGVAA